MRLGRFIEENHDKIVDGTRDQFLDILGHDLRNPLHAISTDWSR